MANKFKRPAGADVFITAGSNANTDTTYDTGIDIVISADTGKFPWSNYNKKSVKKKVFNLKINDYYLEVIRHLSNPEEGISMQNIVQEIIIKELDKRIKDIEN
jgi:hypothetical protein